MEDKLAANDGTKSDWRNEPDEFLLRRLWEEVDELTQALMIDGDSPEVMSEASDVANIAMMLFDKRLPWLGERGEALAGKEEIGG